MWLRIYQKAGVDLVKYGQREQEVKEKLDLVDGSNVDIMEFTLGKSPSDLKIVFDHLSMGDWASRCGLVELSRRRKKHSYSEKLFGSRKGDYYAWELA